MSDQLSFRTAVVGDEIAIRDLTRAAYAKWLPLLGREPKPMGADYEAAVQRHRIELLYRAKELVGLVEMTRRTDHLLVVNVAVSPSWQGKGFGHLLMARAEEVAAECGYSELRLYTHHRFLENIRLYKALGYQFFSEEKIADGFVIHMSKTRPARH